MPLDWLIDPKASTLLGKPAVVECWPLDVSPVTGAAAKDQTWPLLADGTPVRLCLSEAEVIKAWREERQRGGRYSEVRLGERIVKAVHLPDCCSCRACHPEFHGARPRVHGPGVLYRLLFRSKDDTEPYAQGPCLCHPKI